MKTSSQNITKRLQVEDIEVKTNNSSNNSFLKDNYYDMSSEQLTALNSLLDETTRNQVINLFTDIYTAKCFEMIMRLKLYMKSVYNISEAQCLAFSPFDKPSNFDKCKLIEHARGIDLGDILTCFIELNECVTTSSSDASNDRSTESKIHTLQIISCAKSLADYLEENLNGEERMVVSHKKRKSTTATVESKVISSSHSGRNSSSKGCRNSSGKKSKLKRSGSASDWGAESDSDEDYCAGHD
jgi:hypothetical protein